VRAADDPSSLAELTVLDWIGVCVASFTALALFAFPLVGRTFAATFRDLGTPSLPLLTQLALAVWFPPALGLLVAAGISVGVFRADSLAARRAIIVGSFLLGAAAFALCLVALYLPIFELAGNVK
jgi:hypothetical protein